MGKSAQDTALSQGEGFICLYKILLKNHSQWSGPLYYTQDGKTEYRRRNCFKGLLLQNPACLWHWEKMDLWHNIKCSEHESREVQNKVAVHGISFQHHMRGASMGILSPQTPPGWQRRASQLQPCSEARTGRALLSPLTLCRVQGGCTSKVRSPSSRRCRQAVLGLMCPADRTARCATALFRGVVWSLMGYPARGARQD